jgi:hypothetical protein
LIVTACEDNGEALCKLPDTVIPRTCTTKPAARSKDRYRKLIESGRGKVGIIYPEKCKEEPKISDLREIEYVKRIPQQEGLYGEPQDKVRKMKVWPIMFHSISPLSQVTRLTPKELCKRMEIEEVKKETYSIEARGKIETGEGYLGIYLKVEVNAERPERYMLLRGGSGEERVELISDYGWGIENAFKEKWRVTVENECRLYEMFGLF